MNIHNIRIQVNRIRHSLNLLEDYLLIQENNIRSAEVIRTMRDVNNRCDQLRVLLQRQDIILSVIPEIQPHQELLYIPNISDLRMQINLILYSTCNIVARLLNEPIGLEEIITDIQQISQICRLSTEMILGQELPQPPGQAVLPPPAQGGKIRKKYNKTKNRKLKNKQTKKK